MVETVLLLKEEEYMRLTEECAGYCSMCNEITKDSEVEPDAEEYQCPQCGEATVCGIEQALLMGKIEIC